MNLASLVDELLSRLWTELMYLIEDELHRFLHPLEDWMTDLVNRPLPADWRQRLDAYLDEQHAEGFEIAPDHRPVLENHIESWAAFRGMLPRDAMEPRIPAFIRPPERVVAPDVPISPREPSPRSSNNPIVLVSTPKRRGPAKPRLPRGGRWISGRPGNGTWKPSAPIDIGGKKVSTIPFRDGMPVFDKWSKGEVTIAITGDPVFDRTEAIKAWRSNGGGQIPKGYVFHHDGLVTKEIKFKGVDLIVGRMQLVPEKLNSLVHVGSASLARRFVGDQVRAQNAAREVNSQSFLRKGPLTKFAGRFKSKIPQAAKAFARASLPLVGGMLVLVEFSENAKAHGVGGAIIRGTPLLGDIVNVYDVASDLAAGIEEDARESIVENLEKLNAGVREATQAAAELTVDEFKRLSQSIRVSNRYFEPASLKIPVEEFFDDVYKLLLLRRAGRAITYPDDATPAEKAQESPFNFKLRVARERLEREIRLKCEDATVRPSGPQA